MFSVGRILHHANLILLRPPWPLCPSRASTGVSHSLGTAACGNMCGFDVARYVLHAHTHSLAQLDLFMKVIHH